MIQFYVYEEKWEAEAEKLPQQEINWCLFLIGKLISSSAFDLLVISSLITFFGCNYRLNQ